MSAAARFDVAQEMAGRMQDEVRLYRAVFGGEEDVPVERWPGLAATILVCLRSCFPDITLSEYLGTSIRYTLRQLGFPMEPVARVRILTWLAAQYFLLLHLPE
jgi:hypothetical protein